MACPDLIELETFLSGDLDGKASQSILQHIDSCSDCSEALSDARENLQLVDPQTAIPHVHDVEPTQPP